MELNKIYNGDSRELLNKLDKSSIDIIYSDPPYNLGSEYYIDGKGHYRFTHSADFMAEWDAMDGLWWHEWFKRAYRVLKPGGWIILHNIDRQSDMWTYYGRRVGMLPYQKLYWIFAGGFPRGVKLGTAIDNRLGVERERTGIIKRGKKVATVYRPGYKEEYELTLDTSPLAKKYSGYQYGMITLRQTVEEVIVLNKPIKKPMADIVIDIENGNTKLHAPIFNIGGAKLILDRPSTVEDSRVTPQVFIERPLAPYFRSDINKDHDVNNASELFVKIDPDEHSEELVDIPYKYNKKSTHERDKDNTHITPKPIDLVRWVIKLFKTPTPMVVLDPFAGSGTIPLGCQQLNVDYIGFELNKDYCNIANKRLERDKEQLSLF